MLVMPGTGMPYPMVKIRQRHATHAEDLFLGTTTAGAVVIHVLVLTRDKSGLQMRSPHARMTYEQFTGRSWIPRRQAERASTVPMV